MLEGIGAKDLADRWTWSQKQRQLKTGIRESLEEELISQSLPTKLNQIDSVGGAFKYGMYQLVKEVPTMATQFALAAAAGLVTKNPMAPMSVWASTSYILGAGEVYASALAETGERHVSAAMAAGIPIALLDTLPVSKVLRGMGKGGDWGNWVGRNIQGKWKRRAIGAMETSVAEGTTEAFQSVIEQMAVDYVAQRGINFENFKEALTTEEFRESAAAGATIGLVLGPFAAGSSRSRSRLPDLPPPPKVEDETTVEARDALAGSGTALDDGPAIGPRTEVVIKDHPTIPDGTYVGGAILRDEVAPTEEAAAPPILEDLPVVAAPVVEPLNIEWKGGIYSSQDSVGTEDEWSLQPTIDSGIMIHRNGVLVTNHKGNIEEAKGVVAQIIEEERAASPVEAAPVEEPVPSGPVIDYIEVDGGRIEIKSDGVLLEGISKIDTFAAPKHSSAVNEFLKRLSLYSEDYEGMGQTMNSLAAAALSSPGKGTGARQQYVPESTETGPVSRPSPSESRQVSPEALEADRQFWAAYAKIRELENEFWGGSLSREMGRDDYSPQAAEAKRSKTLKGQAKLKDQERQPKFDREIDKLSRDLDISEIELAMTALNAARIQEEAGGSGVSPDNRTIEELETFLSKLPDYIRSKETQRVRQLLEGEWTQLGDKTTGTRRSTKVGKLAQVGAKKALEAAKIRAGQETKGTARKVKRKLVKREKKAESDEDRRLAVGWMLAPLNLGNIKRPKGVGETTKLKRDLLNSLEKIGISGEAFRDVLGVPKTVSLNKLIDAMQSYVGVETLASLEKSRSEAAAIEEDTSEDQKAAIAEDVERSQVKAIDENVIREVQAAVDADRAALEKEEKKSVLVRDIMEKGNGSWKSIEKGEISEKDVRDLASAVGVEGETIEEVVEGLHAVDDRHPITEFEIQQALDPNIFKAVGKSARVKLKERQAQLKKRVTLIKGRKYVVEREVDYREVEVTVPYTRRGKAGETRDVEDVAEVFVVDAGTQEERTVSGKELVEAASPSDRWLLSRMFGMRPKEGQQLDGDAERFIFPEWLVSALQGSTEVDAQAQAIDIFSSYVSSIVDQTLPLYHTSLDGPHSDQQIKAIVKEIINSQNAITREANKDLQKRFSKPKLFPMIRKGDSQPLPYANDKTSDEVIEQIEKSVNDSLAEPKEVTEAKDKVQKRLARKAKVKKPTDKSSKQDKDAWNKLRPKFASPSGLYVMLESTYQVKDDAGEVIAKAKELYVAYDQSDEQIAAQDFNQTLRESIFDAIDALAAKYGVIPGSTVNTWEKVPKGEIVEIFKRFKLPLDAWGLVYNEGQKDFINFSELASGTLEVIEGREVLDLYYVGRAEAEKDLGFMPDLENVFVGDFVAFIPKTLRPFMSQKRKDGTRVVKEGKQAEFNKAFNAVGPDKKNAAGEAIPGDPLITDKEKKKFASYWRKRSEVITVTTQLSPVVGKEETVKLTGRVTNYTPAILSEDLEPNNLTLMSEAEKNEVKEVQKKLKRQSKQYNLKAKQKQAQEEVDRLADSLEKLGGYEGMTVEQVAEIREFGGFDFSRYEKLLMQVKELAEGGGRRAVKEVEKAAKIVEDVKVRKAQVELWQAAQDLNLINLEVTRGQQKEYSLRVGRFIVTPNKVLRVVSDESLEFATIDERVRDVTGDRPSDITWVERETKRRRVYKLNPNELSFDLTVIDTLAPKREKISSADLIKMLRDNATQDRESVPSFLARASDVGKAPVLSVNSKVILLNKGFGKKVNKVLDYIYNERKDLYHVRDTSLYANNIRSLIPSAIIPANRFLNISDLSKSEIKDLWFEGDLVFRREDGKLQSVPIPESESSSEGRTFTVTSIDATEKGVMVRLEGKPQPYPVEEVQVIRSAIQVPVVDPDRSKRNKEAYEAEVIAKAIARPLPKDTFYKEEQTRKRRPGGTVNLNYKTLSAIKTEGSPAPTYVKLRGEVHSRRKNFRGAVIHEVAKDENGKPMVRVVSAGYNPSSPKNRDNAYVVLKMNAVGVWLGDPITGRLRVIANYSRINEKSVNSKTVLQDVAKEDPASFGFVEKNLGYKEYNNRDAKGRYRSAPNRRWVNGEGTVIEEYRHNQSDMFGAGWYYYTVTWSAGSQNFTSIAEAFDHGQNLFPKRADVDVQGHNDNEAAEGDEVFEELGVTPLDKENEEVSEEDKTLADAAAIDAGEIVAEVSATGEPMNSLIQESQYDEEGISRVVSERKERKGSTVEAVFNKLRDAFGPGIFNIISIVETQADLPVGLNTDEGYIRGVAYNNQVWLVADNVPDHKIIPVAMHEVGAHGIRAIIGTVAYQKLLTEVGRLTETDASVREAYTMAQESLAKTHPDASEALILEETMAYYVENNTPSETSMWRKIIDAVLAGLHRLKLTYSKDLSGWQIMVLVRSSMNTHSRALSSPGSESSVYVANYLNMPLYHTSEDWHYHSSDDAALRASGIEGGVDFIKNALPEAKGFGKILRIRWGSNEELKGGEQLSFPAWMARRRATEKQSRFVIEPGEDIQRALVDYFAIMEKYEKLIVSRGGMVTESVYRSHGEYKNVVNERRIQFRREYIEPFQDFARNNNLKTGDVSAYLYAIHAKSVNNWKDPKGKKKIPPAGIWNTKEQAAKEGGVRASADGILEELESRLGKSGIEKLEKVAPLVYRMNDFKLQVRLEGGLMSQNEINEWMGLEYVSKTGKRVPANEARKEFARTYVPIKGDNLNEADSFITGIFEDPRGVSGMGIRGRESEKLMGRHSAAENVWAWSMFDAMDAIDRAEKNKVDQALARFVYENQEMLKNHMMVIKDSDMGGKGEKIDLETGKLYLAGEGLVGLHSPQLRDPEHVVSFKQGGQQWHILVRDKRIGRAFNRTKVYETGKFLNTMAQINRYFAMIHTSLSPEFILTNFSRDYQTALFNVVHEIETRKGLSKTSAKQVARKITKDAWKANRGIHKYLTTQETDTEWSAIAREFTEAGGKIEFYGFKDVAHVEKTIDDYVKLGDETSVKNFWKKHIVRRAKETPYVGLNPISDLNSSVENTMRLSTYKTMKEEFIKNGMTESEAVREAADVARNLTVNFTMKGEKTPLFNSWFLFFNAGTAGSSRALQSFNKSRNVRKVAKYAFLSYIPVAIANYLLAGDDDEGRNRYAQIPMNQRHRQIHIYVPGADGFAKVPLAYGFNMPFVLADTLVAMGMGQINPAEAAVHILGSFVESFAPLSPANSDRFLVQLAKTVSPTIGDPIVDIVSNENWVGNPIFREPFPGAVASPPAYRSWASTTAPSKWVAETVNNFTGGSKYEKGFISVDPTIIDYMAGFVTGSLGKFLKRSGDYGIDIVSKGRIIPRDHVTDEVSFNRIPLLRRFILDESITGKWDVRDKYNAYSSEILSARAYNQGIIDDFGVNSAEYRSFKESDHYRLSKLDNFRKSISGKITNLYKDRAKIKKNRLLRNDIKEERIKKIELRIRDLRTKMVKMLEDKLDRGIRFRKAA
jgi:hypothetical protein